MPSLRPLIPAVIAATTLLAGCESEQQQLDQAQPIAVNAAVKRAQFEMNCPSAQGMVISREMVQPVINAPMIAGGVYRAEYTVGVSGCNQRATYVVVCPQNGSNDCFAGDGR